ncbi:MULTISPECIES: methionine ABC transporter ATP-binding protein [Paracoccus]|uniref:Cell division ATP-binding protein FtsE n=1 Tax=Paracoccus litorisediminis TaxID=2006130 RepID=A0A844HMU5_9RHOB|nr:MULTISPECIES: ATP-binding cassette domain-containing protein [Paracoccus]MBD9526786.1 ATP-binding cassette domain-containing protein [Paracoccus sp. PAR01]MTH59687.1 ATP-binding cassette domain-containing protein [Paracoccus litorisediminis]
MAEPAISFQGVTRRYPQKGGAGDVVALQDIALDVPQGAITGIIGRSGAGKSTLLRMVNGLERPSSGQVIVNGHDVGAASDSALRGIRREVGMIFQHFNLLASRTVAQNIALPLEIAGVDPLNISRRVEELIARVGLTAQTSRYPAELSGGQKQRVGIARALATGPRVLLSDEATSALDPDTTRQVLDLLKDINRDLGLTILLITHEMAVVRDICSHVAVIEAGKIVEAGETYAVFSRPTHPTTRSFLQGVTGVAVPQFVAGQLRPEPDSPQAEAVVQITFTGRHATDPMLARLTSERGVSVNILAGAIEEIGDKPFGSLIVGLPLARLDESRRFLEEHGLLTEVLGYVG